MIQNCRSSRATKYRIFSYTPLLIFHIIYQLLGIYYCTLSLVESGHMAHLQRTGIMQYPSSEVTSVLLLGYKIKKTLLGSLEYRLIMSLDGKWSSKYHFCPQSFASWPNVLFSHHFSSLDIFNRYPSHQNISQHFQNFYQNFLTMNFDSHNELEMS